MSRTARRRPRRPRRGVGRIAATLLRAAAALLPAVAAVAAPATAGAAIVPRESIAGIELEMTRAEVREQLGAPTSRVRRHWGVSDELFPAWRYRAQRLVVVFVDERVLFVETRSRRERTNRGVGPGSTRAALLRHIRGSGA